MTKRIIDNLFPLAWIAILSAVILGCLAAIKLAWGLL